ncbi:MAG: Ig-like domain-containing protein, partial [Planctomycetaceae bacterium]|nr:Ig-like domain-containing protein [Planctomycetaceae bacterium]
MRHIVFLVLWCCCLSCLSGCGGTKLPEDFPKVHPMTVTVKDGTTPLSEVRLMFYPATTGSGAAYASSGSTDVNGVAKIRTAQGSFSKEGILCTLHSAFCALHFALCTLHFALCTLHFALCT